MDPHALLTLEFDRLRELLADRAASGPGRALARGLGPCADPEAATEQLALLGEVLELHLREPGWPHLPCPDLSATLGKVAAEGAVLDPAELVDVAAALRLAGRVRGFFRSPDRRERSPRLWELAEPLLDERDFPKRVERSFEPSGEVRDEASSALAAIRAKLRRRRQEASGRLEAMGRGVTASGEGTFVTLRGGRYVLSLAAAERRRLPGIVHDRSATGKTVYVEPIDIVELNNQLAELDADERLEVHRILREMSAWVRGRSAALRAAQQVLARFDELNARARLSLDLQATVPTLDPSARTLRIVRGRHPLLLLAAKREVVPLDLTLEGECRSLVISGPNMGGKTVVLKTVGLLTLMALSGLHVPAADGTVIPWVDAIFVDIGDEQSLDFDLSTYAGHLRNMRAILDGATARSLVLIDELGAGTDPDEGAALGTALLREVGARGSLSVTTTHLGAFKAFAAETPGFANAAMEHDPQTLAPTYVLHPGVPGRSHAFELAHREGWPPEVLERARGLMSEDRVRTESLVEQVEEQLQQTRRERERIARDRERLGEARAESERLSQALQEKMHAVRVEKVLEEDRRLRELQRILRAVKERLAQLERPVAPPAVRDLRRWVHAQEREAADLRKTQERPLAAGAPAMTEPLDAAALAAGVRAYCRSLGAVVTVREIEHGGGHVWVERRGMRVRVPAEDLAAAPASEAAGETAGISTQRDAGVEATLGAVTETVSGELDLRGLDRLSGRRRLEMFLDRAILAGVTRVRIIHGKGTGVLRQEVRRLLEKHPQVEEFREGEPAEGGWGVSIAFLQGHRRKADA